MELIIINEKKLKVMLSGEEMIKYDLDCLANRTESGIHSSLRGMMSEIQQQTGFNTGGEKMYIQLYPCHGGGCELYVTVIDEPPHSTAQTSSGTISLGEIGTTDFCRIRGVIYGFDRISDLTAACRAAAPFITADTPTTAYVSDSGGAFLVLGQKPDSIASRLLAEFGRQEYGETVSPYIHEHWRVICDRNAAQLLAGY